MQHSFSRLWDGYENDKEAIQARNKMAKDLRARGYSPRCFSLRDQLKKYDGLGQPNGGVCNVYFVEVTY